MFVKSPLGWMNNYHARVTWSEKEDGFFDGAWNRQERTFDDPARAREFAQDLANKLGRKVRMRVFWGGDKKKRPKGYRGYTAHIRPNAGRLHYKKTKAAAAATAKRKQSDSRAAARTRRSTETAGQMRLFNGKLVRVPNPAEPPCAAGRKPVGQLTDRAKRYRANSPACLPDGPRRCAYCGSTRNVEVHHADGNENNGRRSNLVWACRSCNTAIGAAMKAAGVGRRTRQYNPEGATTLAQYAHAIGLICRHRDERAGLCSQSNDPEVLAAVRLIRDTPASTRRDFARQAAAGVRSRGRRRRGSDHDVPF
jgi:5-methylcytosine-specific restriction endonuclease McrA